MTSNGTAEVAGAELDRILRERLVRTMFQPVVHLESGAAVGFEALVRGPEGSSLESADSLFEAAYGAGRVAELDWVARASACHAALAAGLDPEQLLCLNVEPLALDSECRPDLWPDIERAFGMFRIVLEVTERTLDRDPGLLLDGLDRVRPRVVGFALDVAQLRAGDVPLARLLDLDDIGTHPGQQLGAHRAGLDVGHVDDPHAREGFPHLRLPYLYIVWFMVPGANAF